MCEILISAARTLSINPPRRRFTNFFNGVSRSPSCFPADVLVQNVHRVSRASRRRRSCGRRRTLFITCTASPASCAADSWPPGTSFTSWKTGGWCARWITRPPNKMVGVQECSLLGYDERLLEIYVSITLSSFYPPGLVLMTSLNYTESQHYESWIKLYSR